MGAVDIDVEEAECRGKVEQMTEYKKRMLMLRALMKRSSSIDNLKLWKTPARKMYISSTKKKRRCTMEMPLRTVYSI